MITKDSLQAKRDSLVTMQEAARQHTAKAQANFHALTGAIRLLDQLMSDLESSNPSPSPLLLILSPSSAIPSSTRHNDSSE